MSVQRWCMQKFFVGFVGRGGGHVDKSLIEESSRWTCTTSSDLRPLVLEATPVVALTPSTSQQHKRFPQEARRVLRPHHVRNCPL